MKTICLALGIALFTVFIVFAGMRAYHRWASVQYFGKVAEIRNGSFLMQTNEGVNKLIATGPDTVIRKGRHPAVEGLQAGNYIIVVGTPDEKGVIKADMIRIVSIIPPPGMPKK